MNQNNRRNNENKRSAWIAGAVGAGVGALVAGGAYWLASRERGAAQTHSANSTARSSQSAGDTSRGRTQQSYLSSVTSFLENISMGSTNNYSSDKIIPNAAVPMNPQITNLNGLLSDIYVRFIQLKEDDFQLHYEVFSSIFNTLHQTMKNVDPYFNQYASDVKFAGSHYDRLRIKRADEFDMDIVVSLPLSYKADRLDPAQSDIVLQAGGAGFVQLRMGQQFRSLPRRDGAQWLVNRTAWDWGDAAGYLQRSRFIDWFKGVVARALARHAGAFVVRGAAYSVRRSDSGPAVTLHVAGAGLRLDVDLVPALKFPEDRWPVSARYRHIPPSCKRGHWLLVPKPDKSAGSVEQSRLWRIALQDQERQLLNDLFNCKQVIRLVKKLRDAQDMKKIASYYVKTLFLWEVVERDDRQFWRRSPAELFTVMVRRLHRALLQADIPYFWNKDNNLIAGLNRATLDGFLLQWYIQEGLAKRMRVRAGWWIHSYMIIQVTSCDVRSDKLSIPVMPPRADDDSSFTDYIPPIIAFLIGLGGAYFIYSMMGGEEAPKQEEGCEQYRNPKKKSQEPKIEQVKKYR